jgi:hypothetical protein
VMEVCSTQLKCCTACRESFPATATYFQPYPRGKHGVVSECRPCRLARKRKDWARDAERLNAQRRADPGKRRTQFQAWIARHPDYWVKWYATHQEEVLARAQQRYDANPTKYRAQGLRAAQRRQERLEALPYLLTEAQRQAALTYWGGCCAICSAAPGEQGKALAFDHWIPLADDDCPGTVAWNMVPLCDGRHGCNTRKHDCKPLVFLRRYYHGDMQQAEDTLHTIETFFIWVKDQHDGAPATLGLVGGATL